MNCIRLSLVGALLLAGGSAGWSAALQPVAAPLRAPHVSVVGEVYWPPKGAWERKRPSDVGMDDRLVLEAVEWAKGQGTDWPRDFSTQEEIFGKPLGPVATTRAEVNGVIVRRGFIVAEFGDVEAVDPTYSAAKSYLSTIAGLAVDRRMIRSVKDPVREYVSDGG